MTRSLLVLCILCVFAATTAFGHLCNNIYRTPDRLIVKPERDVIAVDKSDDFRIFVQNNYPEAITDVRLTATTDAPGITVQVTPQVMSKMKPGQKGQFVVKVRVGSEAAKGAHSVRIGIGAKQLGFRPVKAASTEELRKAASRGNKSHMVLAAESLARIKDPVGVKVLTDLVRGSDREYAVRALRSVGKAGDSGNADLARGMLNSRDGLLRGHAILTLGLLHVDRQRIQGFTRDQDEFVRACALAAMAMQKDASVFPALLSSLQSRNAYVRIAAGWGLAYNARQEGLDVLDAALGVGDASTQVMAGDALVHVASLRQ
jgi:hypothetical protein